MNRQDKRKIGAIVGSVTIGVPLYLVIASLMGLIDMPITTEFLAVVTVFAFVFSLPMIVVYLAVKDKTP